MTNNNLLRKAEDLIRHNKIIDPEGNVAVVRRVRRIDHQRCLVETDLGVAQVGLKEEFIIVL